MNADDIARERRFDAELAEVMGDAPPEGLAERIAGALAEQPAPRRRPAAWLVAAVVLLGVGVVALVARSVAPGGAPPPDSAASGEQDPQPRPPVVIRNADVREEGAVGPDAGRAVDRILEIAGDTRSSVVVLESVTARSEVDVDGLPPREAIERIAKEVGAAVRDERGVLLVGAKGKSLPRGARITLKAGPVSVRELMKQVHAKTGLDVVVAGGVTTRIDCDVVDVPWFGFVQNVAGGAGCELVGCGSVLVVRPKGEAPDRLPAWLKCPVADVVEILGEVVAISGKTIFVAPGVSGRASVQAFGFDERGMLDALAHGADCEVTRESEGIRRVVSANPRTGTASLTAENMTARELLTICAPDVVAAPEAEGQRATMSLYVDGADWLDVAKAIATAAGRTVERQSSGDGYEWR